MQLLDSGASGRRPVVIAALTFALMYGVSGPLLALLPKAALAGVMVTIALALSDRWTRQLVRQWWAGQRSSALLWNLVVVALVCAVTLVWGFAPGVLAGVVVALWVFVRAMNRQLVRATGIEPN